jgi:hypothetical protein
MGHLRQLNSTKCTYGVNFSDIGMVFKLRGKDLSEVHFPGEKFRNHTNHINVAIKAISPQTEASKNFESISKLL